MFEWRDDVYVPFADLWLDPRRRRERAFVSHAHGDHIGRHQRIVATRETARLMQARLGRLDVKETAFGEWFELDGGARGRLHPAGHVLGAAQIEVERDGERLVYTGDFRLERSETAAACAIVPCDVLVMECTFGRPHYRFPPRGEVVPKLAEDLQRLLADGATPILLAYALGRAQELLQLLAPYRFRCLLAPAVHAMVRVYEELGVTFGPYELARPGATDDAVVFVPPHASGSPIVRRARRPVLLAATGWACDGRPPYAADRTFPFSDHADFDELCRYVDEAKPREVYTMNGGFHEFVDSLRARGVRAHPVTTRVALT